MFSVDRSTLYSYRGGVIDIHKPKLENFVTADIVDGLVRAARWSGQGSFTFSVAEHSLNVSQLIELSGGTLEEQLSGLLHDASEAYLGDLPSPIKALCPNYRKIEKRFQNTIYRKFGLPEEKLLIVSWADGEVLRAERSEIFSQAGYQRTLDEEAIWYYFAKHLEVLAFAYNCYFPFEANCWPGLNQPKFLPESL